MLQVHVHRKSLLSVQVRLVTEQRIERGAEGGIQELIGKESLWEKEKD